MKALVGSSQGKLPPRPVSEATVEKHLVEGIKARGGLADKTTALGRRGYFDRVVVLGYRVVFVELKRPKGGRLSPHQKQRHEQYRAAGATIATLHSIAEVDNFLHWLDDSRASA